MSPPDAREVERKIWVVEPVLRSCFNAVRVRFRLVTDVMLAIDRFDQFANNVTIYLSK